MPKIISKFAPHLKDSKFSCFKMDYQVKELNLILNMTVENAKKTVIINGVVVDKMARMGHEQVVFCQDKETGLRAIIAIHDTTLGPALGGTRMWNYVNEEDALQDVLRLSRGMSFKAAISGLELENITTHAAALEIAEQRISDRKNA